MEDEFVNNLVLKEHPKLTKEMQDMLEKQNSRIVSDFKAQKLEKDAQKNWDLFYKRNETRFFKDRLWTIREFKELAGSFDDQKKVLLEVGCGVGNMVYPLIEEKHNSYFIYACDFSQRAVDFVKKNELYDESKIKAFQCDITSESIFATIKEESVDIITMIFVLSAIHPEKFKVVAENLFKLLKKGGILMFRDYGLYDMAQLRFKSGNKIAENFYVRQDGTRSYFFSLDEAKSIFESAGFEVDQNNFIQRRTINKKEDVDVKRWFIQGKYIKP
ncbi:hypothetical protein ACKWTF_009087 [Chironomus riparius]